MTRREQPRTENANWGYQFANRVQAVRDHPSGRTSPFGLGYRHREGVRVDIPPNRHATNSFRMGLCAAVFRLTRNLRHGESGLVPSILTVSCRG